MVHHGVLTDASYRSLYFVWCLIMQAGGRSRADDLKGEERVTPPLEVKSPAGFFLAQYENFWLWATIRHLTLQQTLEPRLPYFVAPYKSWCMLRYVLLLLLVYPYHIITRCCKRALFKFWLWCPKSKLWNWKQDTEHHQQSLAECQSENSRLQFPSLGALFRAEKAVKSVWWKSHA